MVDTLNMYPNGGVFSYGTNRGENTYVLSHKIKVHPVDIVNTIDVGYYNENTEAHYVSEQNESLRCSLHATRSPRSLFITSEDFDTAPDK